MKERAYFVYGSSIRGKYDGSVCGSQRSRRWPEEGGAEDRRLNESSARWVSQCKRIGRNCAEGGRSHVGGQEAGGQIFCQLLL